MRENGLSRRPEHGRGRPAPDEDAYVDPLCELREEVAHSHGVFVSSEGELGREVPAREVHVRASAGELLRDSRKKSRSVDENLDRVARSRRVGTLRPTAERSGECVAPADLPQAPRVMRRDRAVDRPAYRMTRCDAQVVPETSRHGS
jgi:hypothetical protein